MNSFFKEYLADIIPVTFNIKMDGNEQRIGEGIPEFTITVKKMPDKKLPVSYTHLV